MTHYGRQIGPFALVAAVLCSCAPAAAPVCLAPTDGGVADQQARDVGPLPVDQAVPWTATEVASGQVDAQLQSVVVSRLEGNDMAVAWVAVPYDGSSPQVWVARVGPGPQPIEPVHLLTLQRASTYRLSLVDARLQLTCGSSCVLWVSLALGGTDNNPIWAHCFSFDKLPLDATDFPDGRTPWVPRQTSHISGFRTMQQGGVHHLTYASRSDADNPYELHLEEVVCGQDGGPSRREPRLVPGLSGTSQDQPTICWAGDGADAGGPVLAWREQDKAHGLWEGRWGPAVIAEPDAYHFDCVAEGDTVVLSMRAGGSRVFPLLRYARFGQVSTENPWQTLPLARSPNHEASLDFTMALKNQQLMLFWQGDDSWPPQLQHCRVRLGGDASCTPEVLTDGVSDFSYPEAVATEDGVGLVFRGMRAGRDHLYYRYFPLN